MTGDWIPLTIQAANTLERAVAQELFKASNIGKEEDGELYYNAAEAEKIRELIRKGRASYGRTRERIQSMLVRNGLNPVDVAISRAVVHRPFRQPVTQLYVYTLFEGVGREPLVYVPAPQIYLILSLDHAAGTALTFFRNLYNDYLDGKTVKRCSNGNVWIVLGTVMEYELTALRLVPVKETRTFSYRRININYGIVAAYSLWTFESIFSVIDRHRTVIEVLKAMGDSEREVLDGFYDYPGLADEVELFLRLGEG